MSDEIRKNDDFSEFEKRLHGGKLGSCPNLTHLEPSEKERIAKGSIQHCAELLMKTYMSLGISGKASVSLEEGISGRIFNITFSTSDPKEGGSNDNS